MSIKNAQEKREPAGRRMGGGMVKVLWSADVEVGTGSSSLGEGQLARGGVIIEDLRVASPLNGRFELAA